MTLHTNSQLTDKQQDILLLLYRFRFLNRTQIQTFLHHKKFNRIIAWLNNLTYDKYTVRDFTRKVGGKPAVYSLGLRARRELLKREGIKLKLLKRVYQENHASDIFRNHCITIADVYLSLLKLTETKNAKLTFLTKTDLTDMKYFPLPHPDAFFSIEQKEIKKRYFLDIFDEHVSTKWLYKRVQQYFKYYEENYWQDHNKNPFPEIIFVYQDLKTKDYLEKLIKRRLEEFEDLSIALASADAIRQKGISKEILYKVT